MAWRAVAEWIGFQMVWLACALGAARGLDWPGVAAALVFLAAVLAGRGWDRAEIGAVLASGAFGAIAESLMTASGLVAYAASAPGALFAPLWMIALWLAFGGTLPALDALVGAPLSVRAVLLGGLAGPLAYLAGARLGAVQFTGAVWPALLALALIWAVALPALLHVRRHLHRARTMP